MSSFVNSPKHFDDAQCTIAYLISYDRQYYFPYELKKIYPDLGYPMATKSIDRVEQVVEGIFDTIAELQVICVNLQYKHHNEGRVDECIKQDITHIRQNKKIIATKRLSIIELYKSLQCIRYQIETEHLTGIRDLTIEESNAMLFLNKMINDLAHHIVSKLNDYESAAWSR